MKAELRDYRKLSQTTHKWYEICACFTDNPDSEDAEVILRVAVHKITEKRITAILDILLNDPGYTQIIIR